MNLRPDDILPADANDAVLIGRVRQDDGPHLFVLRDGALIDLSALAPTASDLFDLEDPAARVRDHQGDRLGDLADVLANGRLLAPCDLQAVKAAGVTFADSLIERVIEERAKGDMRASAALRHELTEVFGGSLKGITPGSPAAEDAKRVLTERGLWSQYLEVGIGPDPEIFTKAQPLSAVGCGAAIGLHPKSQWNNPEPEIVLAVSSRGMIVGAALGNDVNLRDFEGRSALLLSKAKDNNASCAIGPFVRLFDKNFTLDAVREENVHLRVEGQDQFVVEGTSSMREISRSPEDLVRATIGPEHQYPDGLMLFLGTMFVPTADRGARGEGFTHRMADIVSVFSPRLGTLVNRVTTSDAAPPWTEGARTLMRSLAARGLL